MRSLADERMLGAIMGMSGVEVDPLYSAEAIAADVEAFLHFTKGFNEQYDEIIKTERTLVARVALGLEGTFERAIPRSAKSSQPAPTIVMLDLARDETGPRSWMLSGAADDQYEVLLEEGAVTVFAYEMSLQGGLLRARRCNPEETVAITQVIQEICTTPCVHDELTLRLDGREALLAKAAGLDENKKHEKKAKKHLLSGQHLPPGVSRSLLGVVGQVDHKAAVGL